MKWIKCEVLIRQAIFCLLLVGLIVFGYQLGHTNSAYHILLIVCPLLPLIGWCILGKENYSLGLRHGENDSNRVIKLTLLHSILLVIAICAFYIVNKAVFSWSDMFVLGENCYLFINEIAVKVMFVCISMIVLVMLVSIHEFRKYSIRYYSIICHGSALICTVIEYRNLLKALINVNINSSIILRCEWVYVEGLMVSILFLFYCRLKKE